MTDASLACFYVNAEGKANSTDQCQVLIEAVSRKTTADWLAIATSKADFLKLPFSDSVYANTAIIYFFKKGLYNFCFVMK